jgi:hypothetical protein
MRGDLIGLRSSLATCWDGLVRDLEDALDACRAADKRAAAGTVERCLALARRRAAESAAILAQAIVREPGDDDDRGER